VKTFKFLDHSVDELEKNNLAILLPFYVLKLRKRTVLARTSKRRAELAGEMKSILDELVAAADRAERAGLMSEADKRILLEHMDRLHRELFAQYTEFKEADVMLQDRILTYSEEAAQKAARKATREATKKATRKAAKKAKEAARKMAKKMLERGMALSEVAEIVELPVDELQALVPNT
jgi:hypothetical protein